MDLVSWWFEILYLLCCWSLFLKRNFFTVLYFDSPPSKYYSEMYKRKIVFLKYINKEVSKWKVINTLVLRILFWLQCTHGTWLAYGTYQTALCSPQTFKHLSHCGTKDCIVTWKKLVSGVCGQEVTDCFTSACDANFLQACCFFQGLKSLKSLGPLLPTGLVTGYSTMPSYGPPSLQAQVVSIVLDPLRNVAGEHFVRYQHEASCHLLTTDTSHWFLLRQDTSLGVVVEQKLKYQWWLLEGLVCTICYPCCTLKSE
jgi:hypothetical protein